MAASVARRVTVRQVAGSVALALLLVAGCSDASSSSKGPVAPTGVDAGAESARDEAGSIEPSEAQPAGDVTVRVIDEDEFARALRADRGKVVLVDFWATWCLSCLELFPHTVELHERLADRGLAVISVSFDEPEQKTAVLKKLVSNGATFDNFISRYGGSDKSVEAFGLEDGSLPYYQLYDRTGTLRESFRGGEGPIDVDAMDRAVEELLGET